MTWLPRLTTDKPDESYELAIKLSRMAVKQTQPDDDAMQRLRLDYAGSADGLIQVSLVVATNFNTISQANNYWRG